MRYPQNWAIGLVKGNLGIASHDLCLAPNGKPLLWPITLLIKFWKNVALTIFPCSICNLIILTSFQGSGEASTYERHLKALKKSCKVLGQLGKVNWKIQTLGTTDWQWEWTWHTVKIGPKTQKVLINHKSLLTMWDGSIFLNLETGWCGGIHWGDTSNSLTKFQMVKYCRMLQYKQDHTSRGLLLVSNLPHVQGNTHQTIKYHMNSLANPLAIHTTLHASQSMFYLICQETTRLVKHRQLIITLLFLQWLCLILILKISWYFPRLAPRPWIFVTPLQLKLWTPYE